VTARDAARRHGLARLDIHPDDISKDLLMPFLLQENWDH
jgi:hypothetical protein